MMAIHTLPAELSRTDRIPTVASHDVAAAVAAARGAQRDWAVRLVGDRLRVVRGIRKQLVERAERLIAVAAGESRRDPSETLAAEIIPLADACRFLEREAGRILATRRLSRRSRPLWLTGVSAEVRREPLGIVLILGAANYPIFLPGVQTLQAVAAGNAVLLKPGAGGTPAAAELVETFMAAGLPTGLVQILPEDPQCVPTAVAAGVAKVFLTGAAETGRRVQRLLAESLTPATLELSGCDAVFVLESADLARVASCLVFGLRFNQSATCIAPRRVFVPASRLAELERRLRAAVSGMESLPRLLLPSQTIEWVAGAVRAGARVVTGGILEEDGTQRLDGITILSDARPEMALLRADIFAPVLSLVPVASAEESLHADDECPFALGAAVFGTDREAAAFAAHVQAGCVVINDMIVPTADPRIPFGGRRQSGFGVTRGAAGLEEMTHYKVVLHRRNRWLPHLDPPSPWDARLLMAFLGLVHGRGWRTKLRSLGEAIRAANEQRRWQQQHTQSRRGKDGV